MKMNEKTTYITAIILVTKRIAAYMRVGYFIF